MDTFKEKFDEYRWTLRLAGKSSEILDRAASILSTSIETMIKEIPEYSQSIEMSSGADEEYESPSNTWSIEQPMEQPVASPSTFSEGQADMFWQGLHISSAYENDTSNLQFMGQDGNNMAAYH